VRCSCLGDIRRKKIRLKVTLVVTPWERGYSGVTLNNVSQGGIGVNIKVNLFNHWDRKSAEMGGGK